MLAALDRVLPGLWAGCLCTAGYLAAPVLFAGLEDRATAGRLAGDLFSVVTCASLVIAAALLLVWQALGRPGRLRPGLTLGVAALLAANEWGLRPAMDAARLADGTPGPGFGALHGVSSVIWLVASLGVLWLAARRSAPVSGPGG